MADLRLLVVDDDDIDRLDPDVAIVDVVLPDGEGVDVIRSPLRRDVRNLPSVPGSASPRTRGSWCAGRPRRDGTWASTRPLPHRPGTRPAGPEVTT